MTSMIKLIVMMMMATDIMTMPSFRGEKRLEVEDEIRKQVDAIMREELDLLKMVILLVILITLLLLVLLLLIIIMIIINSI